MKNGTLIAFILILIFFIVLLALVSSIPPQTTVTTINLETDTQSLDWGTLSPGSCVNRTINVRSNSTSNLTFSTCDWQPVEAEAYFALTWNYSVLAEGWTPIMFTLSLASDVRNVTDFSFNIKLEA